jgi:hypothetical protein
MSNNETKNTLHCLNLILMLVKIIQIKYSNKSFLNVFVYIFSLFHCLIAFFFFRLLLDLVELQLFVLKSTSRRTLHTNSFACNRAIARITLTDVNPYVQLQTISSFEHCVLEYIVFYILKIEEEKKHTYVGDLVHTTIVLIHIYFDCLHFI